jgi:hexosaminidase
MRMCRLLILAAMSALTGVATAASPAWSLLPQPAEVHPAARGAVTVSNGDRVLVQAEDDGQALAVAKRFAALVATTRGLHLRVETRADKRSPAAIVFRLDLNADAAIDAGYRIAIGDGEIEVTARTARGLFYGGVTVWQLLTPDGTRDAPARVAGGTIADRPRFAWRGLMLDSARHFQSVADIKKLIDWMSLNKLNVLHWHLSDDQGWRIEIPNYPELTKIGACRKAVGPDAALTGGPDKPYCGFYTDEEVRDIVHYAAERFVEVVP